MAGIGNRKKKPDGNVEINLLKGRMIDHKTKPPARQIITTTTTTTTKKNKNPNLNNNGSTSKNLKKKKTDLGEKLGQDGKLTPAERARQFANNLCLFCSGVGHTA